MPTTASSMQRTVSMKLETPCKPRSEHDSPSAEHKNYPSNSPYRGVSATPHAPFHLAIPNISHILETNRSQMDKGEKSRQRIIEESVPVFNTKGYAGTSMSDLMESTGFRKGGIYHSCRWWRSRSA